ncbi:hypothetical protein TSOC_011945 [Tetrabaena socialis]|uniref:Uncharacterized protein n=1 Tax=Tetrabaena socialis TaxID=47790 RepID=A0A2J7ZPB8_9CHLO|nr:hypothetical protein TSOC_011945 [Tetrabaena socialis]|eukprot:PNH02101.1 hypothetical protein TSOC_011945 [Tetrabaena socialis]
MDADYRQDATNQTSGARFAALPETLRVHILALTDSKSAARAAAVSRSFRADAHALRSTPSAVAQLLTITYGTPGTVLASMYMHVGRTHLLETEEQFLALASSLQAMGARLVRPLARNPAVQPARWYEGAAERGHIRVLALALEAGEPPANAARALHLAAEHGRAGTLRLLLERGAAERINIQELVAAAAKGKGDSEGTVLAILEEGGAWLPLPFAGRADLAHTVLGGLWRRKPPQHRRVVDWCLGQPDGPTCCLLWAAEEGDYEMVCAALAAGADTSALGGAALQRAACNGSTANVGWLLQAGAAATGAKLDALIVVAAGLQDPAAAAGVVAALLDFGLGSAHGTADALSAAARRGNLAVLNQLLEGGGDWSAPVLLEAMVGAGEQARWAALDCLLPQLLVRTQQQPEGLGPDADLLRAAAAGDAGGAQAAVAAGVSLRAMQLAVALAVRGGFVGAVEALAASPGWAAQLVQTQGPLSGMVNLVFRAADEAIVQALLMLLDGTWQYMEHKQHKLSVDDVLKCLQHHAFAICRSWVGLGRDLGLLRTVISLHPEPQLRFKEHTVPWDAGLLPRLQRSALHLLAVHLRAALVEAGAAQRRLLAEAEAAEVGGAGDGAGSSSPAHASAAAVRRQEQARRALARLLDGSVSFAFRVHQLVGGFDPGCIRLLEALGPMWREASGRRG